jgi:DNA-binding transcriptional regulator YhcF (GntR family)
MDTAVFNPIAVKPTTATKCYEYLAARGFLLHHTGKEYFITNFRGGKCFTGTLSELKLHLKDEYYGEPVAH